MAEKTHVDTALFLHDDIGSRKVPGQATMATRASPVFDVHGFDYIQSISLEMTTMVVVYCFFKLF